MPRIRLCDEDRERYGGPEWVEISMSELIDESAGLIERIEEDWDLTPEEFVMRAQRASIKAIRAMIWAARFKAGCSDDPRTFRPKTQKYSGVTYEPTAAEEKAAARAADADPPANRAQRRAAKRAPGGTAASKTSSQSTESSGS